MKVAPFVSFVIPVRNDAARLRRCLASIRANAGSLPIEIIVVDNGSMDDSANVARSAGARVLPLPHARVSEARNLAAAQAAASIVAFVDADHVLSDGWLEGVRLALEDQAVSAVGAPYSSPDDANWVQRAYAGFRPVLVGREPTQWLGSGNLVVRKAAFQAVSGFDATLESCEDVDLCNRLIRAGHMLIADPRLRSVHLGDPRTLRALFFGELWRGRDNIRVTLRGPLTADALPSLLIPVLDLGAVFLLIASPWLGWVIAAGAAAVFAAFAGLRASRMSARLSTRSALQHLQNVVVAAVYDLARSLALVVRATHRTRREVAGERAVA